MPPSSARTVLFVSYTPADEGWATWIAWELESAGYRVVLQAWDFVPGTNFVDFMDRGVAGAGAVIAVLSRSYLYSRFGRWEWQTAILADPGDAAAKLITVRVEDCPIEGLLSTITYVDLVGVPDPATARDVLLTRVSHTLAGRAKPATSPLFPNAVALPALPPSPNAIPGVAVPNPAGTEAGPSRGHPRRRPAARPEFPPAAQAVAAPRDDLVILHVPGPRFSAGDPAAAAGLQARIWADVNHMVDAGAPRPDLLVVSGDLTEAGGLREFDQAITFLTGLRALLGLEPYRCVIVPGSHDITQKACQAYFGDCEADDIEPRPPYWPKWRHYSRVFDELYRDIEGVVFDRTQPWTLFPVPDLKVVIAGLNSTMAESHRAEDRYGWLGEAQAAWFAEQLRPYADDGWLRLAAVAHDPASLRDPDTLGRLAGSRVNALLHGQSRAPAFPAGPADGSLRPLASPPGQAAGPLVIAADDPGRLALIQFTAGGLSTWRAGGDTAVRAPERTAHAWNSASATFPPPPAAPEAAPGARPGQDNEPDARPADPGPDEVSGRAAAPTPQLLDRVAEVVEVGHPGARIRRVAEPPPHLLVTHAEGGFFRQWRVAAHAGEVTREIIEAFAAQLHSGELESGAELVYSGPRPPAALREEALRRGIRVRSFTEFQGLLDLRDYVAGQTARLQADLRYPHALYVPQRFRDLEAEHAPVQDNLVEDLLRELAADSGRFLLLLGDFGRGKTFALRELARHLPARLPHLIPIYLELRSLDKAHSVDGLVAAHLANHGEDVIDLKAFRYMLAQGRVVLLFDGFDELATRVTYDRAADHLQTLLSAAEGKAKIVVASRTQHFKSQAQVLTALGERVELLPSRRVLGIEDFNTEQIRSYLGNAIGEESAAKERLALISEIENLLGLSSNPRMLSFIAALDAGRLRAVAGAGRTLSAAELYRAILDSWLSYEHQRAGAMPGAQAGLSLADLWRGVTVLAMRMTESGEAFIPLAELNEEAATSLAGLASGQLSAQQTAHAIGSGSLLVPGGDGVFGFIHASVAEWLVASEIAAQLRTGSQGGTEAGEVPPPGPALPGVDLLGRRPLSPLTIEFLCDLAGPEALAAWTAGVLGNADAANAARANALRVSARMRIPARTDLRGAVLRGEDLSHREFGGVDFTGADLTGARFVGANLAGAVLRDARLVGAWLDGARLPDADLRGADLRGARLFGADLSGARTDGSRWSRAAVINVRGLPDAAAGPALRGAAVAPGQPVETELAPAVVGVPYGLHYQRARLPQPLAYTADGSLLVAGNADGGVLLCDTATGLPVRTLRGHRGRVYGVTVAAGDEVLATAAADGTIRLWDAATGECTKVITVAGDGAWPAETSPDGRLFAYGSGDGVVRLLDLRAGLVRTELPGHTPPVYTVAFGGSGDQRVVVTGDQSGTIRVWDQATGDQLTQLTGRGGPVFRLLASHDGLTFAAGGSAGTLLLLSAGGFGSAGFGFGGFSVTELAGHTGRVYALDFHPDQPLLASGDTDGGVRLWDLAARAPRAVLASHPGAVYGLTFSPDGSRLASACSDGLVRITEVADGRVSHELTAHRSSVWRPLFRPDGGQLATASNDGTVRLWDAATGQSRHLLRGHGRRVTSVTFSADGGLLAAGDNDGVVRVWDPVTGQRRQELTGAGGRLVSAVFGPAGPLLATASSDGGVYLWNAASGSYEREMNVETERVWAEAFSPDGELLATANDDDSVRLWYRTTGRLVAAISEHRGRVRSLAFSADGRLLATGCDDREVRVYDVDSAVLRAVLHGHADRVYAVTFSPSGDLLASAGNDGVAYLWDPVGGTAVRKIEPGGGRLWTTAFSPSGRALATAGDDGAIRLWSVPGGEPLPGLPGHAERVGAVAFSPSGNLLASAADDGCVRLWHVPPDGSQAPDGSPAPDGPSLRATLLGTAGGWGAFAPDGRYKADGDVSGQFWHAIGLCRFEPGELDAYLPGIARLPMDAPF
ncbi:MAG TPA: TIR domain-containing protein [Trebonia sp.]